MMRDRVPRCTKQRHTLKRSAITLVEVMGTLSVLLVLGVSTVSLLGSITDIGLHNVRGQQGRASVQRFAQIFRLDVHGAGEVTLSENHWPIELSTKVTTIRYEWDDQTNSIRRSAIEGETRLAVDQFQLPDRCDPRISLSKELVTVVLRDDHQTQPWIIEASRR